MADHMNVDNEFMEFEDDLEEALSIRPRSSDPNAANYCPQKVIAIEATQYEFGAYGGCQFFSMILIRDLLHVWVQLPVERRTMDSLLLETLLNGPVRDLIITNTRRLYKIWSHKVDMQISEYKLLADSIKKLRKPPDVFPCTEEVLKMEAWDKLWGPELGLQRIDETDVPLTKANISSLLFDFIHFASGWGSSEIIGCVLTTQNNISFPVLVIPANASDPESYLLAVDSHGLMMPKQTALGTWFVDDYDYLVDMIFNCFVHNRNVDGYSGRMSAAIFMRKAVYMPIEQPIFKLPVITEEEKTDSLMVQDDWQEVNYFT